EYRLPAGVIAAAIRPRQRAKMVQFPRDLYMRAKVLQRFQRRAEGKTGAVLFRPPSVLNRAVGEENPGGAQRSAGGCGRQGLNGRSREEFCGCERLEGGQRDAGAKAAQKVAAAESGRPGGGLAGFVGILFHIFAFVGALAWSPNDGAGRMRWKGADLMTPSRRTEKRPPDLSRLSTMRSMVSVS